LDTTIGKKLATLLRHINPKNLYLEGEKAVLMEDAIWLHHKWEIGDKEYEKNIQGSTTSMELCDSC
jgi:hypothetical protein